MKKTNSFLIIYLIVLTGIIGSLILPFSIRNEAIKQEDFNNEHFSLKPSSEKKILRIAMVGDIDTIDPVDSWDYQGNDVINQITEPLVWYDITSLSSPDESIEIVPCLAKSWSYDVTGTNLTMNLREDVWFHDGAKFDATAAYYSIERLLYFTNSTGELADGTPKAFPYSLYYFDDGITPIIKDIEKTGEFQIKFILNKPFGPFISLLGYTASNIVSPNTPNRRFLDLGEDTLIGTGPFELVNYTRDSECWFKKNDNWWGGNKKDGSPVGSVYWDEMIYKISETSTEASEDLLDNRIAYTEIMDSLRPEARADPDISIKQWGTKRCYYYWGLNCKLYDQKERVAIAYALNYTYVNEVIKQEESVKANTCLSAVIPGHNSSVRPPAFNIQRAREILNSFYGTSLDINDDAAWNDKATNNPFRTIKLFRHEGSHFNELLNAMVEYNLAQIGFDTTEDIHDWTTFLQWSAPGGRDNLEMWYIGWCPTYLSAFNVINPLFNPDSDEAAHQCWAGDVSGEYTDLVTTPLKAMEQELDPLIREQYAMEIQDALFDGEDALLPHIPMRYNKLTYSHSVNLKDISYNSFDLWYWAPTSGNISYNLLEVEIISPFAYEFYSDAPNYSIEIKGEPADKIWYSLDSGKTNYFGEKNGTINEMAWDSMPDGLITIIFSANNSKGFETSDSNAVIKDTTSPTIKIISPNDDEVYGDNPPSFIVEIMDNFQLDKHWYSLNGGTEKHYFGSNATIDQNAWLDCSDGEVKIGFFANDSASLESSKSVKVYKNFNPADGSSNGGDEGQDDTDDNSQGDDGDEQDRDNDYQIFGYELGFLIPFLIIGIGIVIKEFKNKNS